MNSNNDILSIKSKVFKVINSQLNISITGQLINNDLRRELGLNSSEMNSIVIMLEKLYHIPISEEDFEAFNTINDVVLFIEKKHQKKYIIKQYTNSN
jgi:acyl carrier protein